MARASQGERLAAAFPLSIKMAQKTTTLAHRANPYLNILNLTVKSVTQYPELTGQAGKGWRLMHSIKGAGMTIFRALRYWPLGIKLPKTTSAADVVIVSHLTNSSHLSLPSDFYFGGLAKALSQAGFSTHTILINHCRANSKDEANARRSGISLLPAFLSPWAEVKLIFTMAVASLTLPKLNGSDAEKTFSRAARLAQFSSRAIGDMRIGTMVSTIIASLRPRVIIHTFEGHGWERIMTASAHAMTPSPHVIGYQHAVLFPGLKSISYRHGNGADPDYIFTVGQITHDQLLRESEFDQMEILGSVKSATSTASTGFTAIGACLIAPEGTLNEVMIMAEQAIAAARITPDQTFILRLHPVLKRQQIDRMLMTFAPHPKNFIISTVSLDEDFARCSWLCYRGSTLAFQGMRSGLRPIYLNPDHAAVYNDPLPAKAGFRRVVDTAEDLVAMIQADRNNPAEGAAEWHESRAIAESYVMPLCPEVLIRHLNKVLS